VHQTQLLTIRAQTKGKSLEEINALFGDEVVVHFADATEKQRHELTAKVLAEDENEKHDFVSTSRHAESPSATPVTAAKV
jgi:hypothetical protein